MEQVIITTTDEVDDILKDNPELKATKLTDTLSESEKQVLDISKEYDWEQSNILGLITHYKAGLMGSNSKLICKTIKTDYDEIVGFYIINKWNFCNYNFQYYKEADKEYSFNFIFIKPQYRNKGYFKNLLKKFMEKYECISFDGVESDILENALEKRSFKKIKPCRDGRGFYYGWLSDKLINSEYKELIEKNDSLTKLLNKFREENRELKVDNIKLREELNEKDECLGNILELIEKNI
jgi:FtsZ-binding cell division protein ZapB